MQECICGGLNSGCIKCGGGGFITAKYLAYSPNDEKELERLATLEKFPKLIQSLSSDFLDKILNPINLNDLADLSYDNKIEIYNRILQVRNGNKLQSELKSELINIPDEQKREQYITELNSLDPFKATDILLLRELRTAIKKETALRVKAVIGTRDNVKQQLAPYNPSKVKPKFKAKRVQLEIAKNSVFNTSWIHIFNPIEFHAKALRKDIDLKSFKLSFYSFLQKNKWSPITSDPKNLLRISYWQLKVCEELLVHNFHQVPYNYIHTKVLSTRIYYLRQVLKHLGFHAFPPIKQEDFSAVALQNLKSMEENLNRLIELKQSNVNEKSFQEAEKTLEDKILKLLAALNAEISTLTVQAHKETVKEPVKKATLKSTDFGSLLQQALEKNSKL